MAVVLLLEGVDDPTDGQSPSLSLQHRLVHRLGILEVRTGVHEGILSRRHSNQVARDCIALTENGFLLLQLDLVTGFILSTLLIFFVQTNGKPHLAQVFVGQGEHAVGTLPRFEVVHVQGVAPLLQFVRHLHFFLLEEHHWTNYTVTELLALGLHLHSWLLCLALRFAGNEGFAHHCVGVGVEQGEVESASEVISLQLLLLLWTA